MASYWEYDKPSLDFSEINGEIFQRVERTIGADGDEIHFYTSNTERYVLHHWQDCCESVYIEDICGDLKDLENTEIIEAVESVESREPTWTFYNIRTHKGSVTIRWCGQSNGYYSESVNFKK